MSTTPRPFATCDRCRRLRRESCQGARREISESQGRPHPPSEPGEPGRQSGLGRPGERPAARFGELELDGARVASFQEKPQLHDGWINGGYFVIEPEFFDLIDGDETLLEREPLERASKAGELMAYCHDGFWQCMDTKRDHELLESLWSKGAPWARQVD